MSKPTILDEIVVCKRSRLDNQKESMSLSSLKNNVKKSDRDFAGALRHPSPAFILECKKASPSQGVIRPDFDLVSIAGTYGKFASAISVLTEADHFHGSLANLGIVRSNAPQPLLAKDFFVEPYQVYQARHFGADAILLILAILDDRQWNELFQLAQSLEMDVITEVSNREEQQRAISLQAPIVGINNRNLRDMSIDLNTTTELSAELPEDTLVISESGFYTHRQVRSMAAYANGFLIGSSLMRQQNLAAAVKRVIYGECKVCGLTRNEDAIAVDDAGAVYGGVIFADSSPRRVTPDRVEGIFEGTDLIRVGVFQDHTPEQIADTVSRCRLDVIQLHGDEQPPLIRQLTSELGDGYQYWKAIAVHQMQEVSDLWIDAGVERLVVDNHAGSQRGGTGETFDWALLPGEHRDRVIIAGGIGPDNVGDAVATGCSGVDMNSQLEDGPGVKMASKIQQAFERIRSYHGNNG